jgi:hypothetical protein
MSTKRDVLVRHYTIRVVVEEVTVTGVIPYNGTAEEATDTKRTVSEVGSAVVRDKVMAAAITKAKGHLELMGE